LINELFQPFFTVPVLDRLVNFAILASAGILVFFGVRDILRAVNVKLPDGTTFTPVIPTTNALTVPTLPGLPPAAPVPPVFAPVRPPLLNHKIFAAESQFITEINSMNDGSAKAAVNIAFLRDCKFKVIYSQLRRFIADVESAEGKGLENFPQLLLDMMKEYSLTSNVIEYKIGNKSICGVPTSYMRKFDRWHDPHVNVLMHNIKEVLRDAYYYTWWATATACLDTLYVVLVLTLDDARIALADINGDIDHELEAKQCTDDDGRNDRSGGFFLKGVN
jgi:hypothetical protein